MTGGNREWREWGVMPFSALVGQAQVKQALLMLAVNPRLSGLLIRGDKGTGKSVMARGLAQLLPRIVCNASCPFGCAVERTQTWCSSCCRETEHQTVERTPPFENLPLGVTEDRLLGSFDLEHALKEGEKRFLPGLLARVNHGVLYVDELNLLDDHMVDLLLDVAASGVNYVEREGLSVVHPAEFLLVGTMNPEEGELRPQLQDRFGLCAEIRTETDATTRTEIIDRCLDFERDPMAFREVWEPEEAALRGRIARARELLPRVACHRTWKETAAAVSTALGVHGHRADVLMIKASLTLAALAGRSAVDSEDFETAATLVYPHRLRKVPFEETHMGEEELRKVVRASVASAGGNSKKKSPKKSPG